jgi:superfamily II DNA or RNA helicase
MPELLVAPGGQLRFDARSGEALPAPRAQALETAFVAGVGHGLLHLAGPELHRDLPVDLDFGRRLGRRFLSALCREGLAAEDGALARLIDEAPPIRGGEYLEPSTLSAAWEAMRAAATAELAEFEEVSAYVESKHESWRTVGRVVFHLAENRNDPQAPFAFLATYVDGVDARGRPAHRPLGRALTAYAEDRAGLTRLLRPLHDAASASPFIEERVENGEIFQPIRWGPEEAHAFLAEVPRCESAGIQVRVPDWWRARRSPTVRARIGDAPASGLGVAALLDFDVTLSLDGEELSASEVADLIRGSAGLRMLRGRWVEVDPERLSELLTHFEDVQRAAERGELTFAEGMRLLAGLDQRSVDPEESGTSAPWAEVVAGDWFAQRVAELTTPGASASREPGADLRATLRGYQREGVAWLSRVTSLGLGGCLADDMGLGKTMQVLAQLLLLKREGTELPSLLVVPASLLGNWEREAERFAPSLRLLVAHRSRGKVKEIAEELPEADAVITTYGTLVRTPWLLATKWHLVVLDEAQAIKNPGTRQTRAVKELSSVSRIALTGTPVENNLGDLWSLFDFLLPGLLGSASEFTKRTREMARAGGGYAPLRRLIRPYMLRRLKTDPSIVPDLPDKTEVTTYCTLSKRQAALYESSVSSLEEELRTAEGMKRRGLVLAYLQRFKQICNHPSQWLGEDSFAPKESGKLERLTELCGPMAERQERVLVFTQFRSLTKPLARHLATVFGREGLLLHGGTPVARRQKLVDEFQREDGPPFFVISLKAGGTGLNLTAASHVIHFDRWWNPAVENQATDRAYRIGQKKNVLVHKFVCQGTFEERIDKLLRDKQALADDVLGGEVTKSLTELDGDELLALLRLDAARALDG